MTVVVRECVTPEEFAAAREALHGSDAVTGTLEAAELSPENLFYKHGLSQAFVALQDGNFVGRIVASIDEDLRESNVGHFGYFESAHDDAIASGLLAAVEKWLAANGRGIIHGPVNLSILRGYRFQTAGFDRPPFPGEPRNPDYYPQLVKQAGYKEEAGWASWDIPGYKLTLWRLLQLLQRPTIKRLLASGYGVVPVNMEQLESELLKLHPVLMQSFARNYGFTYVNPDEYVQIERRLKYIPGVRAFYLIDPNGDVVGFSFGYSNDGTAVLHTFGIEEKHRGKGLAYLIFAHAIKTMKQDHVREAVGALVKDGPSHYARLGKPGRRYAVYSKEIKREK